jgi:hypothetical protein
MQDVSRLVVSTHLFPWKNRNGSAWMGLDYYSFFSFMGGLFSCVDGREGAAAGRLRWCCKIYLRNESRTPSSAVLVGRLRHSAIIWKEFPAAVAVATSRRKTLSFLRRSRALRGTERALAVAERGDDEDAAPRRSSGYARMMEEAAAAGESGRRQKKRVAGDVEQPLSSQGEEEEAEAASCEST